MNAKTKLIDEINKQVYAKVSNCVYNEVKYPLMKLKDSRVSISLDLELEFLLLSPIESKLRTRIADTVWNPFDPRFGTLSDMFRVTS